MATIEISQGGGEVMTEYAGATPPGREGVGGRSASDHALATSDGLKCPMHRGVEVTQQGTRYECARGHLLMSPVERIERTRRDT